MQIIYNFEISNVYALRSEIRKFSFQNDEKTESTENTSGKKRKEKCTTVHLNTRRISFTFKINKYEQD